MLSMFSFVEKLTDLEKQKSNASPRILDVAKVSQPDKGFQRISLQIQHPLKN